MAVSCQELVTPSSSTLSQPSMILTDLDTCIFGVNGRYFELISLDFEAERRICDSAPCITKAFRLCCILQDSQLSVISESRSPRPPRSKSEPNSHSPLFPFPSFHISSNQVCQDVGFLPSCKSTARVPQSYSFSQDPSVAHFQELTPRCIYLIPYPGYHFPHQCYDSLLNWASFRR